MRTTSKSAIRRSYGYGMHIALHSYSSEAILEIAKQIQSLGNTEVAIIQQDIFAEKPENTEANIVMYSKLAGLTLNEPIEKDNSKIISEEVESNE